MDIVFNKHTYTVAEKPDAKGYYAVVDAKGVLVGLVHDSPDFMVVVPPDAPEWTNPESGPRARVLLHVRDAWKIVRATTL